MLKPVIASAPSRHRLDESDEEVISFGAGIRERFGRGLALVGQDNLRRIVLRGWSRRSGRMT
ncbi:hypothetical protein [Streptomyces sp. NBC_01471]|uniref:hypothetical protein n=1 Tax=Streptomyces sp. NBC_01471 TaxID=2903879 RepID=UPI00352E91D0